jgi:modulator of FtsH protease HflK
LKSDLAFQRRQLTWSGASVFGGLLAYGAFLASTPLLILSFPLLLGVALLPLWILAQVDNGQRIREKAIEDQYKNQVGKIFDDAYEVVLLKRQRSLTQGLLLRLVFIWGSLVLCITPLLLLEPIPEITPLTDLALAPAAFNAFLGVLLFVAGRYLIGISKTSDEAPLSTALAGWWVYTSLSLFTFSLAIFFFRSDLSFLVPFLFGLSVLPLVILILEWPLRAIAAYYGSAKTSHPPYCPSLPLIQWTSTPSKSLKADLEYQFGYDLSSGTKTLLGRMAIPSLLFLVAVLFFGSSVIVVPHGHQGVKLTWGSPSPETLPPGLHLHLPWPMGSHHLLDTGKLHRLHLENDHQRGGNLWGSESHEDDLLMVVRSPDARGEDWPIEVLAVNAELGFRWSEPHRVLFNHSRPSESLRQKALGLLTERMRKVPLNEWWSTSRSLIEQELVSELQAWVEDVKLGAKVVFFSLPQLHPPTEVGEASEAASKARFEKEAHVLKARAEIARLESSLEDDVSRKLSLATSQGNILIQQAEARLKGLQGMSKASSVDPDLFWDRRRLKALAELSTNLRKILILRDGQTQVQELDLESHLDVESFDLKLKSRKLRR